MPASQTGIILLAAGASTRLGKPKQNLFYQGQTLLQHAIQAALETKLKPVILVLGAHADTINPGIEILDLHLIINPDWAEGMGSSIRIGLTELLKTQPAIKQVILMVCDQPFVSADLLMQLVEAKGNNAEAIVASAYKNTVGTPVLFPRKYFPELLTLNGQVGAKKLLFRHQDFVIPIPFPEGDFDIDTMQDYEALQGLNPDN